MPRASVAREEENSRAETLASSLLAVPHLSWTASIGGMSGVAPNPKICSRVCKLMMSSTLDESFSNSYSKVKYKIKIAEILKWPVGSLHSPLGLQIYFL